MNTGQMLLALGAMILLSTTVLRVNNNIFSNDSVLYETKFNFLATSLATSIIQEAKSKAFDNSTDSTSITDLNLLTSPNHLGPETGETYDSFNDFDDYNNYSRIDSSMQSAPFNITCIVTYAADGDPDSPSNNKSWNKVLTVTVTSPYMSDEIKMSTLYSYWFFR